MKQSYPKVEIPKYSLDDLKLNRALTSYSVLTEPYAIFDAILKRDRDGAIITPARIGIDGPVTAGKTFYALQLHSYLKERGVHSVVIHGDWFLASREERSVELERARAHTYSILSYEAMHCDFKKRQALVAEISTFLKKGTEETKTFILTGVYNRATGRLDDNINFTLEKSSVVICEGTGVLSTEMRPHLDLSIRIDVASVEETLHRLQEREASKQQQSLHASFLEERYRLIDLPYDAYLRARDKDNFDVLLDTTDRNMVRLYNAIPETINPAELTVRPNRMLGDL